jgi:predicted dienelactone hydrolase
MTKLFKIFVILLLVTGICHAQPGERLRKRLKEKLSKPVSSSETVAQIQIAGRKVSVWENRITDSALSPLVIFSHGFHGCSTQSSALMKAIAANGFIVMAPSHADASCRAERAESGGGAFARSNPRFNKPNEWNSETYRARKDDIEAVISGLKSDPNWSKRIDFRNISLAGHSLGGYTVLALAGAWPSWKLQNISAVLALSPYTEPFLQQHTLGGINIPVMFQGGTRDFGITPALKRPGGAYDQAKSPAYFINFKDAGHFSWTDISKKQFDAISNQSILFLKKYALGDQSLNPGVAQAEIEEVRKK